MFAAGKTAAVSGAGPDDKFNYVTMLLHGDGTNGAQNNTFLDSGPNTYSITRNGNTTQGSFSPYGSNWSNFFDGTGDYLSIADNAALDMGSSSFTIEGWILLPANVSAGKGVFGKRANNGVVGGILFYFSDAGVTPRLLADIGGSWGVDITASSGFTLGQWNHFATVRNSNTWTIYINGTSVGSATNSGTVVDSSAAFTIMAESAAASEGTTLGYISNFRVVKGTAVYTSAFTPSTTPLTAITNTSLLTCQSNRFIDNSSSPKTLTVNGNTSVQRFNPFGTSTAYSTSVIGGSGYFDGTGDYLNTANSSAFAFGTGDFTVECWINTGSNNVGLAEVDGGSTGYWMWHINAGTMSWQNTRGGANLFLITGAGAVCDNAWHHLAIVRNSSVTKAYWDGVEKASASDTTNYSGTGGNLNVAYESAAGKILNGYMANFRIVKGTAVYTAAFTPPTAPLTAVTNTSILLNTVNGAIFDNAMMNDLETAGNAQISTSVKKYGTGSIAFDGTGDTLKITPDVNVNMDFGTGPFTFECWIYRSSASGQIFIADFGVSSANGWALYDEGSGGNMQFRIADTDRIAVNPIPATTWTHVAIVRVGTTVTLYVNGTSAGSYASAGTDLKYTGTKYIGSQSGSSSYMNGYMDDIRITKGFARYTANFTAPTAAFSDTGPY